MRKKSIGLTLCALLFALCASAHGQQPRKVHRIGYLSSSDRASDSPRVEAIWLALRELGYKEGENIATEYRYADGKPDRAPELAAELVRLKVDIILVGGGTLMWVRPVMNATQKIPIVMTGAGADPVEAGLVESLARPGGNVTGITNLSVTTQLVGKQLELFKEAVPKLARLAVLYDPASRGGVRRVKEVLPSAAHGLGLIIQHWEVRSIDGFDNLLPRLRKERPHGLYVSPGPLFNANETRIVSLALQSQLPSMYFRRSAVDAGGLMSYAPAVEDRHRRVAYFVDKILKGAKPADLPVEQPTKFELAINLKTAKQIGLTIPQSFLYRADKVIK